jgi:hypothetical protein
VAVSPPKILTANAATMDYTITDEEMNVVFGDFVFISINNGIIVTAERGRKKLKKKRIPKTKEWLLQKPKLKRTRLTLIPLIQRTQVV